MSGISIIYLGEEGGDTGSWLSSAQIIPNMMVSKIYFLGLHREQGDLWVFNIKPDPPQLWQETHIVWLIIVDYLYIILPSNNSQDYKLSVVNLLFWNWQ